MPGYVTGESLNQLFSHARIYAMPSYHEGLPIALLEALSFGLRVVVSDIPANSEVGLPPYCYFSVGNLEDLSNSLDLAWSSPAPSSYSKEMRKMVQLKYNWDQISDNTIEVYRRVLRGFI